MIKDYPPCETCPLRDRPSVVGKGVPMGLCIVSEAPGRLDSSTRELFPGSSGKLLKGTLVSLGVDPDGVYLTNTVACSPKIGESVPPAAITACHDRLMSELARAEPARLLLLGAVANKAVTGSTSIVKSRGLGRYVEIDEKEVFTVATYHPAALLRDDQLYRDFSADISKLINCDEPTRPPQITTVVTTSIEETLAELLYLAQASIISCDLEASGLSPIRDRIYSIGFGVLSSDYIDVGYSVIIPFSLADDPIVKECIEQFITNFPGDIVFHNAKFDLQFLWAWFRNNRVQPLHVRDTMLMQYALDERGGEDEANSNTRGYATRGLKDLARLRYDIPDYGFDWKAFHKLPEEERNWRELYEYQGWDCYFTARLFVDLSRDLLEESPKLVDLVDDLLVPVSVALARVELHGAPLDREFLEGLKVKTLDVLDEYLSSIRAVATANGFPETFNPNSVPQMLKLLNAIGFQVTSTEKETLLLEMRRKPPYAQEILDFVKMVLDYRQRSKVLKTYVEGMLSRMDVDDCVRPDFIVQGTPTGRLACRDPNLQNIPTLMGPEIRNAFVARPGYALINADYSQLELRVAAWYADDTNLRKAFAEGKDVHRWVAALMFKKPEAEITHLERYLAKYLDFGLIYGRGAKGITEGWEAEYIVDMGGERWTLAEAEALTRSFFRAFPMLETYIQRQHEIVRAQHYVETPMGRRRRFPLQTGASIGSIERKSVNTPIQSLASDMTLTSIVNLDRLLPEGAAIISTVHDSIMFEVREELVEEVVAMIHQIMEKPCIPEFDIPLKVDINVGVGLSARWGLLKD